ncbi:MAG TPA: GNAT family N-acetyltransferase [Candidatus Sulfomarinibacteraceae bacterium]|nr:GNAT family N-acetyltransferase [Candidatus Sulfomarinibacteraceae bacterium]
MKGRNEVTIRPVQQEDVPALYDAARQPKVARTTLLQPALEISATEEHVEQKTPGRHYLVADVDSRAVGSVSLRQYQNPRLNHSGRLGLLVHPEYWQRGIGTQLVEAILKIADEWLNLHRVELGVFTTNTVAIHLYEKFGFETEGRQSCYAYGPDGWMDHLIMARLRNPPPQTERDAPSVEEVARVPFDAERLTIRPFHPDDIEDVYQILRHPLVGRTTLQMPSQEFARVEERIKPARPDLFRFVADYDGRVVGNLALHRAQNPRRAHAASLGMAVHPQFWGRGVGSALMAAAVDLADNWFNLRRVELDVNVDNPPGVHLYEKFGFEIEGTRRFHTYGAGRWTDSYFMARIR